MLPARYIRQPVASGHGGFGAVTRVRDTYLDRDVMFKAMHDPANNNQLLNEVIGLTRARSKHVVEIYDVIVASDGILQGIVIEALDGRTFDAFWSEASAQPDYYVRIVYQLACAIADLHAAEIVHRDLKLENFRESLEGVVKLYDFGLSTANSGYITRENRGTFDYAAPELYAANALIAPQLDVYALGICCWKLVVNRLPAELLTRPPQQSARAPSIATVLGSSLPPHLIAVIDACLDPNPAARPPAADLRDQALTTLVSGKHKGRFVQGATQVYELSTANPFVRITLANKGELQVRYNNDAFVVVAAVGNVMVNRVPAAPGMLMPEACVVAFESANSTDRSFVTFASSHPEVVI